MTLARRLRDYFSPQELIDTSPRISDEVKCTTCYMCACRCGIKVHLKDGALRYIEGNRDHPVNRGVICGKGASGIMQQLSPAKLQKPLMRVGERGSGEFREIEWEEAIATALGWLSRIRADDPKKLAFFTGRDQSQSLTGYSAIADQWIGIRPGTDGLLVLSLIHELLRADKIDFAYLGRYTNAAWLVVQAPGSPDDGLFARNEAGDPLVLDAAGGLASARE